MYKSPITLLFHRLTIGAVLFLSACGGNESGTQHENALETGQETQNINNEDRSGNYNRVEGEQTPTYNNEDTNMMTRKLQPQDSSAVSKSPRTDR